MRSLSPEWNSCGPSGGDRCHHFQDRWQIESWVGESIRSLKGKPLEEVEAARLGAGLLPDREARWRRGTARVEVAATRTLQRIAARRLGRVGVRTPLSRGMFCQNWAEGVVVGRAGLRWRAQADGRPAPQLAGVDVLARGERQLVVLDEAWTATDAGRWLRRRESWGGSATTSIARADLSSRAGSRPGRGELHGSGGDRAGR